MNWNTTKADAEVIHEIAMRAHALDRNYKAIDADMDITATHLNGNPLKLRELASSPEFDFAHDIFGIRRHIDRTTGKLSDCFSPRYSV